jgi:hypothetical protein
MNLGNQPLLNISGAVTMSCWARPITSSGLGNMMSKNQNEGYRYRIQNGELWFYVSGVAASGGSCPNNVWSHCVATGDSTSLRVYVNGVQVASNLTAFAPSSISGGEMIIGGFVANSEIFNGDLACLQVYNRALTATEVSQQYNATRWRFGV